MDEDYQSSWFSSAIVFVVFSFFYYQIVFIQKEWIFLDYINLAYHEAGHLLLTWASEPIYFFGGSIGQLFFPLLISIVFFTKKEHFSGSVMLFWFFQNGYNISRYMSDAELMELPLVGGSIHDWNWLFSNFSCLHRCDEYAFWVKKVSFFGITISLGISFVFLVLKFLKTKEN